MKKYKVPEVPYKRQISSITIHYEDDNAPKIVANHDEIEISSKDFKVRIVFRADRFLSASNNAT